ncbi:alpha/beta hydrolase [uncultured Mobiluncus sp.]|uniref:alpha/beta hydrolase n=1 Tax=uncultured Mobiluncus sp. TaxID=293425 RepID=UPI002603C212|nr:alpha/beta fold hydrolase [uncultured Mobiluncus sp.]
MRYLPDVLGPGFGAAKLQLEPDQISPRSATLVRYTPAEDPKSQLPDRIVPVNVKPGGGSNQGSFRILPPSASPQQRAGSNSQPNASAQWEDSLVRNLDYLQDYLTPELRGREIEVLDELDAPSAPQFIAVYVHGWNDYFYQAHLARMMTHLGAAFYGIDLHRYGRNMPRRSGLIPFNCYEDDYTTYDRELDWAIATARQEHPDLPVVVMAHSNGGSVVSGWASRHHDAYDGLIFISPWVVQDVSGIPAGNTVRTIISKYLKGLHLPMLGPGSTVYQDSLAGYATIGSPLPRRLVPFGNDPAVCGWITNPQWRITEGAPILFGWLSAILSTQQWLVDHARFSNQPVLCLTAAHDPDDFYHPEIARIDSLMAKKWKSAGKTSLYRNLEKRRLYLSTMSRHIFGHDNSSEREYPYKTALVDWSEAARHTDTVLNGNLIEDRINTLYGRVGGGLTLQQMSGLHDLTLSQPLERAEFFAEVAAWISHSGILNK